MSLAGHLTTYHIVKPITAEFVKCSLEDFIAKRTEKPTIILFDNGPVHRVKIVKECFSKWEEKNIYIFLLPTYSCHLNPIEVLWKFIEYKWLNREHYKSWTSLKKHVHSVFSEYGNNYLINFNALVKNNAINLT
ncbi:transposase [Flectobacillus sp. DC10W]|uniref:Transposase n=2 Tax=Flectobacillus longus TaxID=2984207 RepID=A0ABT6YVC2_9BACT|nr:transposase [Flectobacillus longus]MDI9867399.1 transposase [Flectobacillus longus]